MNHRNIACAIGISLVLMSHYALAKESEAVVLAEVNVSSMFGDNMVLQRDMLVPVWGRSSPGANVTVSFAGQKVSTNANSAGQWKLTLEKLKASSEPREMVIESKNSIVIKNVLVGEVWICSGKSNMQFGWGKKSFPEFNWGGVKELAALADEAGKLPIRSYFVPMNVSLKEEENCKGKWSTEVSGSAVAFGKWHPAEATIKDDAILLVSPEVKNPQACRYAYSAKPEVNLVNAEELPAYPFSIVPR